MDYRFKTVPYNHQLNALKCSWDKFDYAYFMEMGTGKSKVCIDNIAILYDKGHIDSALIVAPKGVYHNWKNQELPIHLPDHINANIVCWTPTPNKKEQAALDSLFVISDNLTIFLMNIEAFSTSKGYDFAYKFLLGHRSLMAVDESTTIKAPTASRTKNILKLRSLAKYRRILTGSPVTKSPLDLYTQCFFLDPDLLDFSSYWTFKNRYALMANRKAAGGSHTYSHVIKYVRLDELNEKLDKFSIRVLKEDCLDLPDKIYMKRTVSLTPEQQKAYYEMKKFAFAELSQGTMTAFSALTQMMRLHQITCGHVTTDDGQVKELKNNRLTELLNILEETNDKIIIWANYRYDIQNITRALQKKYGKESTASLYGDTPMVDRNEIISNFQDKNSDLRYLVSNPKTGGYGITLTASHTVVYYSNSYDLEVRLQSEDRAHRIGQKSKVTYIDLIAEKTVDEHIVKSLRNKINIATQVLGEDLKKWLI
jgi:SNF2 family DNA or RNA helicase